MFDNTNKIKIYTSNFKSDSESNLNSKCQKSQHMFITANYLQHSMKNKFNLDNKIDIIYCIGNNNKLIDNILNNNYITDAIIVRKHNNIIDIIRKFNIDIERWKNKYK